MKTVRPYSEVPVGNICEAAPNWSCRVWEIEIRARDETWQIVLETPNRCFSSTVLQRILSLAIDHTLYHYDTPVLESIGLQDMRRLEKFEVHTCLLIPEGAGRPALPLGSHNLNHQPATHGKALKILHIDAPIKRFEDLWPPPDLLLPDSTIPAGDRLLTCLSSLQTLVSLNISLHLLFSTLAGLRDELNGQPHGRKALGTFLAQCPNTLQNINF